MANLLLIFNWFEIDGIQNVAIFTQFQANDIKSIRLSGKLTLFFFLLLFFCTESINLIQVRFDLTSFPV